MADKDPEGGGNKESAAIFCTQHTRARCLASVAVTRTFRHRLSSASRQQTVLWAILCQGWFLLLCGFLLMPPARSVAVH